MLSFPGDLGPSDPWGEPGENGAIDQKLVFAGHLPYPGLGDLGLSKNSVALLSPPEQSGPDAPSYQRV